MHSEVVQRLLEFGVEKEKDNFCIVSAWHFFPFMHAFSTLNDNLKVLTLIPEINTNVNAN